MNNTRKIFIALFLIVVLPALFYSVYEISALNESEEMISQIYQRQLDAILFSVNQYVLDVASGWATQLENETTHSKFVQIIKANPSIISIITADTTLSALSVFPSQQFANHKSISSQKEMIDRLIRYQAASYRKLEPVIESDSTTIIFFVTSAPVKVVGIVINNEFFINSIISKKLIDIAQNDFVVAVDRQSNGFTLFTTSPEQNKTFSQQRQLWIFPDHIIKIRLKGTTIQDAAQERFNRNVLLIIGMDIVLILGAWFVFRTISREMELIAMKSDFVSNVSHELRTPLSLIRMFAETLEMGRVKTEKKKKEYYTTIVHETDRLTRLINNILNFSRMESNTRRYNFRPVLLNKLISSVLTIYSYQLEKLSFTLQTELSDHLPEISVDEEAIAEALHNLIDNAIKYSGENKYLRIATSVIQNSIIVEVEDHGIGISIEHHSKIFEKFYRVSHGLVHTAKGSGLGLAIVQHIVHSHNGTISIISEPHHGSKFIITLPLIQSK
ncbi:MAG: ATP-binding protein [Bacteroidota bacterium]|nr:ATP-binding protein [Bacteroidota bacterium]